MANNKNILYIQPLVVFNTEFFNDELWDQFKNWIEAFYPGLKI